MSIETSTKRSRGILRTSEPGNCDRRHCGHFRQSSQGFNEFVAIHFWHSNVRQNQIEVVVGCRSKSLLCARLRLHVRALEFQERAKRFERFQRVVDQQDSKPHESTRIERLDRTMWPSRNRVFRQPETKTCALSQPPRFRLDASTMHLRYLLDQREADSQSATIASSSRFRLTEHIEYFGYFKSGVGNAAYEACGLKAEKSSLPAMRNSTVRMVLKLAYPRALRLAA